MAEADETLSQAKGLIDQGQFKEAVELLESWVEHHPKEASAWSALGAAYFELEDFEAALPAARRAVDLDPDNARAWCNFGTVLRKLGRSQEARQAQRTSLSIEPDYERAFTELGKLSADPEAHHDPPPLSLQPDPPPMERRASRVQENAKPMEWWKKTLLLGCAIVLWPIGLLWGLVYLFADVSTERRAAGRWAVGISAVMMVVGALGVALTNPGEELPNGEDAAQIAKQVRQTAPPGDTGTESGRGAEAPQAAEEPSSVDDVGGREPAGSNANETESDHAAADTATDTARADQTGGSGNAEQSPASDPETRERERRRIGRAWLRYGKKQYAAQEYEEALHAFQKAESLGMTPQRWMDACEERIAIAEGRLVRKPTEASIAGPNRETHSEITFAERSEAQAAARMFIEDRMWNPSSADFFEGWLSGDSKDSVSKLGENRYRVVEEFEGTNAFGATVRQTATVVLLRKGGPEDTWVCEAISISR